MSQDDDDDDDDKRTASKSRRQPPQLNTRVASEKSKTDGVHPQLKNLSCGNARTGRHVRRKKCKQARAQTSVNSGSYLCCDNDDDDDVPIAVNY